MTKVVSIVLGRKGDHEGEVVKSQMLKNADKKLASLGFVKVEENEYYVSYQKEVTEFKYTHTVDLLHKANGRHILQSYDSDSGHRSACVGLTRTELLLFAKKMRELGWRS